MKFYLPNFEDLVDPDYNFLTDQPSPHRGDRWVHDRLAHDFFNEPIFDGMLVSKASLSPSSEKYIRGAGGMHTFARLDKTVPVMGDCGAFTYFLSEKPTYTIQQTIDYYQNFDFTYGVSLDHLCFITVDALEGAFEQGRLKQKWWAGKTTRQIQEERFELTLRNAQEFIDLHAKQKPSFTPIGIAQGTSPELYYTAVEQLIKMGYEHIALGGLVKSKDNAIIAILERLQPLIRNGIQLHIFGVARLSLVPAFLQLGVTSADSSAPLRKAFMGDTNYWTLDGKKYQAIRVPEARSERTKRGVFTVKKVLQNNELLSVETLVELEQKALDVLRAYDKGQYSLEDTLEAVLEYDQLYGEKRDHRESYQRTLQDQPWKACDCPICQQLGIEVVIFRGNNRNRRRGFHNVRTFYTQLQYVKTHSEPYVTPAEPAEDIDTPVQQLLFEGV
ncbi:hypothetical protein KSC_002530 [Ktedonobacter sp. SOSP1-52]|uniref:tRNA-guanine transglycosylase DpdA n=1 Tax=Ktedonobacter sp. SOSP1-52 TaxID=2778366 RepID=UPI001915ADA7|nr:tRNA-guanine transglycosylase DpdA [Ktedonobacter sp. SOSP1-52]GHO61361.1 hypothetical protein KSC_002530 [Ktedonobacter sp. SOSP1-52]